jgi:hypothetical protein
MMTTRSYCCYYLWFALIIYVGTDNIRRHSRGGRGHTQFEPDPLVDLAELVVRLRVEPKPLQDLVFHR